MLCYFLPLLQLVILYLPVLYSFPLLWFLNFCLHLLCFALHSSCAAEIFPFKFVATITKFICYTITSLNFGCPIFFINTFFVNTVEAAQLRTTGFSV